MSQQHFDLGGNNDGDEVNNNPQNSTPLLPIPSTVPVNRSGRHSVFYKTRQCLKFIEGTCPNGDNCNFAHGVSDLREPPPNWQEYVKDNRGRGSSWNDDQKIIQRMRICRKFYSGEECPYGDKCTFLHESPAKFRAGAALDSRRTRESSAINIPIVADFDQTIDLPLGSTVHTVQVKTVSNDPDVTMKDIYRKTRLCSRWEMDGRCVFGDKCHFAHGPAELQTHMEGDVNAHGNPDVVVNPIATSSLISNNPKTGQAAPTSSSATASAVPRRELRGFAKLANKKIKGIYGDWIDDEDNE